MSFLKKSRTVTIALTAAIALTLSACSSDSSTSSEGAGNTDVATGGERFSTADAETAKLGSDAEAGVFPRTVVHAAGTTEITAEPKRVVVLDTGELDDVLTLGITPVGMVTTQGANPVPSYLADQVADVESVGSINELNLEAIAALEPDLILGSQLRADKLYPQLAEIAPTVFSIRPGYPWKENFLLIGDALGKEDAAVAALNDYADKVAVIRDSVEPDTTISAVRFMPERLRLYGNKSLLGVILQDTGLARPANQDIDDLAVEISPENIDEANADYIFYSSYGQPDATGETAVVEGSAWKALPAVADGKAFRVDDDVWFMGLGPTGARLIVEQLGEHLGVS
ncbi:iron-siderophore ABC transporter substrate-binding protein [Corynebacterium testudinoris]|uniref:ABC-type Fe3+-hydroxamate transport system, periplasmic component n=1 Tax=Corynebacterium testudinoris TaxID=136857 RepID=A0A0G3H6Y6_9CORY|nr:iron-siderophore ABC transporter substrate-binding protein [Corynebacterium testudinoris]AKK09121.1 ABC-type Fe3+-hydroxamate transport system, periplasmic component [Corynebacterium testudinoris]MBX8996520.1 iron-siderophore ABC transporter substrate-binding protein [Corynebacterium testudinoris]